jgi:subtilisin-like proprotein convertase family protein
MKTGLALLLSLVAVSQAEAALTYTASWSTTAVIPDNNLIGWTNTRTVTTAMTAITSVDVSLQISGGWNGDLYAYLVHDTGMSILLNRVGTTTRNTAGSSVSGMNLLLSDSATGGDVHNASLFSGTFLPDGRDVSPWSVKSSTPRTAMLAEFTGLNPNGTWTLFVADASAGSASTVTGWGLTIQGMDLSAVPEPSSAAAVGVPLLLAGGVLLRRRRESR